MAKNNPAASPAADLANVMSFVANRTPEPAPAPAAEPVPAPVAEPVLAAQAAFATPAEPEQVADSQAATGKKEVAPLDIVDYASMFLKPVRTRKTKAIYVDEDLHTALSTLTQAGGVGLADLLINIANHHFDTFRPAIRQYLNDQDKLKKKKLPY